MLSARAARRRADRGISHVGQNRHRARRGRRHGRRAEPQQVTRGEPGLIEPPDPASVRVERNLGDRVARLDEDFRRSPATVPQQLRPRVQAYAGNPVARQRCSYAGGGACSAGHTAGLHGDTERVVIGEKTACEERPGEKGSDCCIEAEECKRRPPQQHGQLRTQDAECEQTRREQQKHPALWGEGEELSDEPFQCVHAQPHPRALADRRSCPGA